MERNDVVVSQILSVSGAMSFETLLQDIEDESIAVIFVDKEGGGLHKAEEILVILGITPIPQEIGQIHFENFDLAANAPRDGFAWCEPKVQKTVLHGPLKRRDRLHNQANREVNNRQGVRHCRYNHRGSR